MLRTNSNPVITLDREENWFLVLVCVLNKFTYHNFKLQVLTSIFRFLKILSSSKKFFNHSIVARLQENQISWQFCFRFSLLKAKKIKKNLPKFHLLNSMSIRKRVRAGRLIIDARSLCIFTYSSLVLGNLFTAQISGYLNNRNQSCQTIARLFYITIYLRHNNQSAIISVARSDVEHASRVTGGPHVDCIILRGFFSLSCGIL